MPTSPRSPAQHHLVEAEQGLADLGKIGPDELERLIEVGVALVHATLSCAASLAARPTAGSASGYDFERDH